MKFVWLNKQGVASDEGFVLQRVDRYAYEYREANRFLRLKGEDFCTDGRYGFGFYGFPDFWESPYNRVPITEADRERIITNIKEAMVFKNVLTKFE